MNASQCVALAIFLSYFLVIIALFALILSSIPFSAGVSYRKWLFGSLAIVSFAHTWYYMLQYMQASFRVYEAGIARKHVIELTLVERMANWLVNTALFEQAWASVCAGPLNWWWSEQLCLFTAGAWTVFLATTGRKYNIPHIWAYMLLGQLVAISVASNLFYVALATAPAPPIHERRRPVLTSAVLWLCTILSLGTVYMSPRTDESTFLLNMLIMHVLIIIPLLPFSSIQRPTPLRAATLYQAVALMTFYARFRTFDAARAAISFSGDGRKLPQLLMALRHTLYAHPAQSSIGWDVLWTGATFVVWYLLESRRKQSILKVLIALFALITSGPLGNVGYAFMWWQESEESGASGTWVKISGPAADCDECVKTKVS